MGALPTRVGYADQSSIAGWVTGTELFTTSAPTRAETINVAVAQSVQNANDGEIARSPEQHFQSTTRSKRRPQTWEMPCRHATPEVAEVQRTEGEEQVAGESAQQRAPPPV